MPYSRRVIIASLASVLLHGAFFWMGLRSAEAIPKVVHEEAKAPLLFRLEPDPETEQESSVKRLISTPNPTTEAVEETDLISDSDSKAQDESDVVGERAAPHVEEPDEFDRVEQAPSEQQQFVAELTEAMEALETISEPETPAQEPKPTPEEPVEQAESVEQDEESGEIALMEEILVLLEVAEAAEAIPEEQIPDESDSKEPILIEEVVEEIPEEPDVPERYEIAQAQPSPQPPQPPLPKFNQDLSVSRGRAGGGAAQSGVMNFEAKRHELGEYMLEVRRRVERQWHTAIQLRYLGVKRAEATIECIIRPSGIIEEVRIIDPGTSMPFAVLCRDAIKNAGPFPKLSFEIPEFYRSQNIEIRWKFSYL
ncbi:MAG: hypothetical protein VCB26_08170 [Candidatus Hydrogenedentota bacterium]